MGVRRPDVIGPMSAFALGLEAYGPADSVPVPTPTDVRGERPEADVPRAGGRYGRRMDADLPLPLTQRLSRRTWVALDVALAVVLLGATIASIAVGHERRGPTDSGWDGLRYAAAILACASLPLRRRWPMPVLVATVVGDAMLVVLGGTGPAQVAVAFAVYTVAATSARRLSLWAVGVVVATMFASALVAYGGPELGSVIGGPAMVLLGWIAGENTRARVTYAAGVAERAAARPKPGRADRQFWRA